MSDIGTRRILHVDADAFYVAVVRMMDPDGAGRHALLVVGGSPSSRGVVCSASYEARQFGVRSAMSCAQAARLCPDAMFVPVPRGACSKKSREIARVLARYTPVVEGASIDEWYLDLTGTDALYRGAPLAVTAQEIRHAVRDATGMQVTIGGGTNRLVAKMAVEAAKPRPGSGGTGVHIVAPGDETAFMSQFALADIPGVGPAFRARLERHGLRSVRDVTDRSVDTLVRQFGEREGHWLHARAHGIGSSDVTTHSRPKGISREETFSRDVADDEELEHELLRLVTRVCADLRAQHLAAATIHVKLKDSDFRTRRASRTLDVPVTADRVVYGVARELLQRLRRSRRTTARLVGVGLASLGDMDAPAQMALFEERSTEGETDRDRTLSATLDRVRERFGAAAVIPGTLTSPPDRRTERDRRTR